MCEVNGRAKFRPIQNSIFHSFYTKHLEDLNASFKPKMLCYFGPVSTNLDLKLEEATPIDVTHLIDAH